MVVTRRFAGVEADPLHLYGNIGKAWCAEEVAQTFCLRLCRDAWLANREIL
jgi:hypothetical protein